MKTFITLLVAALATLVASSAFAANSERFVVKMQNFSNAPETLTLDCTAKAGNGDAICGDYKITPEGEIYKGELRRGIQYIKPAGKEFKPGQSWSYSFNRYRGDTPIPYTMEAKVSDTPEETSIGGKTYSAYRIDHTGSFKAGDQGAEREVKFTIWYDPSIPLWVKKQEEIFKKRTRMRNSVSTLEEYILVPAQTTSLK